MKVDILSREYPPKVYGGAGVHAEELSKVLAERVDVTVRAFDGPHGRRHSRDSRNRPERVAHGRRLRRAEGA